MKEKKTQGKKTKKLEKDRREGERKLLWRGEGGEKGEGKEEGIQAGGGGGE